MANAIIKRSSHTWAKTHGAYYVVPFPVPSQQCCVGPSPWRINRTRGESTAMMPPFTMRHLFESGVHFGHHTRRWNPKMKQYIFGVRNNTHILDLQQSVPMLYQALNALRDVSANGGRILFVGTKRQSRELVAQHAERCGQYFVNDRWLGGMLTNWSTISQSIKRLKELTSELQGEEEGAGRSKREQLERTRTRDKLVPDMLFVIDTVKEHIAIAEAKTLGIPVVAVVDSNSDPSDISFPIPGNDDAIRAVNLYCQLAGDAILDGLQQGLVESGVDIGASEEVPADEVPADDPAEEVEAAAETEDSKAEDVSAG
jgi:small subunit ribosomal protein S2